MATMIALTRAAAVRTYLGAVTGLTVGHFEGDFSSETSQLLYIQIAYVYTFPFQTS